MFSLWVKCVEHVKTIGRWSENICGITSNLWIEGVISLVAARKSRTDFPIFIPPTILPLNRTKLWSVHNSMKFFPFQIRTLPLELRWRLILPSITFETIGIYCWSLILALQSPIIEILFKLLSLSKHLSPFHFPEITI